jgi:hypothetical protein
MLALLLAATVAAPFVDIQHRFSVNLPPQWAFAPLPGDVGGAAFRRVADGVIANAMVRVLPFNQPVDLQAFFAQIGASYGDEPGFRLLISEPTTLAGNRALRRRFVAWVNGNPKMPKLVEQRVTVLGTIGYVVHVETLADAFGIFERDFEMLFASFAPGNNTQTPVAPGRRQHADLRGLTGKWQAADATHTLELSPSGVVVLDGARGRYHIDNGTLVCAMGENDERMYTVALQEGALELTGAEFGQGQSFRRVPRHASKKAKPPAKAVTPELAPP